MKWHYCKYCNQRLLENEAAFVIEMSDPSIKRTDTGLIISWGPKYTVVVCSPCYNSKSLQETVDGICGKGTIIKTE